MDLHSLAAQDVRDSEGSVGGGGVRPVADQLLIRVGVEGEHVLVQQRDIGDKNAGARLPVLTI